MIIKRVLIVDDDMDYLNELEEYLLQAKYFIIKKNNTEDILVFIKKSKPDLVILDYKINGMTGIDVNTLMKDDDETRKIPVILVSNFYDADNGGGVMFSSGIKVCLKKSTEPERLIYEIKKIEREN